MTAAAHAPPSSDEKLFAVTRPIRYWPREKPGQFKFGSYLGHIVVTDQRFLFLSTGGAGWDESVGRLVVGGLAGLVLNMTTAGHTANDLDFSALKNEGSLALLLSRISHFEAKRPFCLAFVTMRYQLNEGGEAPYAIVQESVAGLDDLRQLQGVVKSDERFQFGRREHAKLMNLGHTIRARLHSASLAELGPELARGLDGPREVALAARRFLNPGSRVAGRAGASPQRAKTSG